MTVELTLINDGERSTSHWEAGRSLARDMLSYLQENLAIHGSSFKNITAIGVYRGPGSYTGLRIGLTVLNTLAGDLQIPIVGANGGDWREVLLVRIESGDDDKMVLPIYGSDANITTPRK